MRRLAERTLIERFISALGVKAKREARLYFTGGATAVLLGWRGSTIDVDILLVPTGGFYTIDSSQASDLVKKIEPSIVIPMHYLDAANARASAARQKNFGQLAPAEEFTKKFGVEKPIALPKLVYKKEEVEEEMKVVVLEI